ncbi:hypothetical protein H2198_004908 [Neophaeococcomyces mojaviensis]|uniref:Uncharacterized protein n=1 Tax=Neophaeococcomyces mojaviensis TaxID=3383035 RepID=A0ACC3A7C9_9EURO|nr:hypothetical protein H2198_004908 [Knufia sp. JES_112]
MPRQAPLPAITTAITTAVTHAQNAPVKTPAPVALQPPGSPASAIEAKIVVIGAQGVGKTSLVNRFIDPTTPLSTQSTVGASFLTKKIHDPDTNTTVRLQMWDTAGQERFRSISKLYYRGANAGILCYDVTNERSWEEMKDWLEEMRENCEFSFNETRPGAGMVLHVVGTKIDLVADDPSRRQVTFERTIAYVAEHLAGVNLAASQSSTPPLAMRAGNLSATVIMQSPDSKRSSGFWTQDLGWDSCHEISAQDNDGIEEVFRVISKKLIDQRNKREAYEQAQTPWPGIDSNDYFSQKGSRSTNGGSTGSFRLGHGHRKSWLGLPGVASLGASGDGEFSEDNHNIRYTKDPEEARRRGRCC